MKKKIDGIKRTKKAKEIKERGEIFYSLLGYFVGVFIVNISGKNLSLNPVYAMEFLGAQISTAINIDFPMFVTLIIGFLLSLIPLIFVYVVMKGYSKK
ncbi:MAG: hypothetical protein Q8Q04_01630 [archaeon]|nr:hypothetical protein [archaeon]